jgi:pilus assembly protein Flp/PilA
VGCWAAVIIELEIEMLSIFRRLMKNTDGATAVEYTLITSLIAVAAIASMRSVSGKVSHVLGAATNALN